MDNAPIRERWGRAVSGVALGLLVLVGCSDPRVKAPDGGAGLPHADAATSATRIEAPGSTTVMASEHFVLVGAPGQSDSAVSASPSYRLQSGTLGLAQPR